MVVNEFFTTAATCNSYSSIGGRFVAAAMASSTSANGRSSLGRSFIRRIAPKPSGVPAYEVWMGATPMGPLFG